jgi:hypothetical protein
LDYSNNPKLSLVAAMVLAASAAHASPLETYQALDDACRGGKSFTVAGESL